MSMLTGLHDKYGPHERVAEFRLFNLNRCNKTCDSCFYQRSGNTISDYGSIFNLSNELRENGYRLETCYLLPTDFFENDNNYHLFDDVNFSSLIKNFAYLGVASTLDDRYDFHKFYDLCEKKHIEHIELQINIITEKIFNSSYFLALKQNIEKLKVLFGDRIVINIALNLGKSFNEDEYIKIKDIVEQLSEDQIVEINFTFLYNKMINFDLKSKKLRNALKSMNKLGMMYNRSEQRYNNRSMLNKPGFIFKDNKAYIAPIIPFDEYAFVESEDFSLREYNFQSYIGTMASVEHLNTPLWSECSICDDLSSCLKKSYFVTAKNFDLPFYQQA